MENTLKMCIDQICRTCMCETQHLKSLFSKLQGEERTLSDVITSITDINVSTQNNLPKQVCNNCEVILCKTDSFIQRALKVDKILNNFFNNVHQHVNSIYLARESIIKHEINVEEDLSTPYQCSICLRKFSQINELEEHVFISHSTKNDIFCELELIPTSNSVLLIDEQTTKSQEIIKEETVNFDFENSCDNDNYCCYERGSNNVEEKIHLCSCGLIFEEKEAYKTHLKTDCLESKTLNNFSKGHKISLICDKCQLQCESLLELKKHKRLHTKNLRINGENVDSEQNKSKYQCSSCMRKFVKKSSLALHIKKHEEDANVKHICITCKREFKHKAHLKNHILLLHTKEKGFICDLCTETFPTHADLETHKQMHNKRKHQCNLCDKAFYMLSTLKDHLRTHTGEKPFLCSECGKGFSQKNNMTQHMRRHQGLKPFKCENCEKRFVSKGELVAHNRKHSGAHPFICPDCGNGFTTSSSLVKHRRTHSGERPYACDLCSMRFAASGTLRNHRRIHTGERPYCCSYCQKSFVQRNDLISHIRCHTGERPFICSSCGQGFRKGSALKAHLKLHLKEPLQLQRDNLMLQGVNVLLSGIDNPH